MESDMTMESLGKLFKMDIKFRFQTFGLAKETLGKSKELMFNIIS